MAGTRGGWIGWWIVTAVLVALVAVAVGCDRSDPGSAEDLLRRKDGDPPVPPPLDPAAGEPTRRLPPPLETGPTPAPRRADETGWEPPPLGSRSQDPREVLRELHWAQEQFVKAVHVDEDFDQNGEYGGLAELARAAGGRMGRPIPAPLVQQELGQLNARGEGRLGDYLYRVWLPGRYGLGIGELWGGTGAAQFEPNLAEDYWLCYAWPARPGNGPTYFISQDGRLLTTDDPRYSGSGNGPLAGAALRRGEIEDMLAPPATNGTGLDGNTWRSAR